MADEPVSALDVSIQAQIVNLLQDLQEQKHFSYLFIAHDLAVVRHIADRVMVMYLGRIVEMGQKQQIYRHPASLYSGTAVGRPSTGPGYSRRSGSSWKEMSQPTRVPAGCSFHTAAPLHRLCRTERPGAARGWGGPARSLSFRKTESDSGLTLRRHGSDVTAARYAIAI